MVGPRSRVPEPGPPLPRASQPRDLGGRAWSPTVPPLLLQPGRKRGSIADFVLDHLRRGPGRQPPAAGRPGLGCGSWNREGCWHVAGGGAGKCGPQGCPYLPWHTYPPPLTPAGRSPRAGWTCSFPSQRSQAPKPPGAYSAGWPWRWAGASTRLWEPGQAAAMTAESVIYREQGRSCCISI